MIARDLPEGVALLLRRAERRQGALEARGRDLRARAERAAVNLVERFGVGRVVLFGSLGRGATHERSDVDLAVWGLAAELETAAIDAIARDLDAPFDLVRMETASPSLAHRIAMDGTDLVALR